MLFPAVGGHTVFERLDRRKQSECDGRWGHTISWWLEEKLTKAVASPGCNPTFRLSCVMLSSPNRTTKSGARFFSTAGMTYGDTAVLSALMRPAMTRVNREETGERSRVVEEDEGFAYGGGQTVADTSLGLSRSRGSPAAQISTSQIACRRPRPQPTPCRKLCYWQT